jgi:hypothetical protein
MTDPYAQLGLRVIADWPKIDEVWERVSEPYGTHLDRKIGRNNDTFLGEAFAVAARGGYFEPFLSALYVAGLLQAEPAEVARLHEDGGGTVGPVLQAMIDRTSTMRDALVVAEGMKRACAYVCRIDIDNAPAGTGVYLREGVVATAAHVIAKLLVQDDAGALLRNDRGEVIAGPDTSGRLTLTFDYSAWLDADGVPRYRDGFSVPVRADWLLWGSRPVHAGVGTDRSDVGDINGIGYPDGPWDLALIRPAAPVMHIHRYPELVKNLPSGKFPINVLQHPGGPQPAGQPLIFSRGHVDGLLGTPDVVRLLHDATTDHGSSGAPLFDDRWRIVGIHERGPGTPQAAGPAAAAVTTALRNRAVPVQCMRGVLDRPRPKEIPYLTELPDPYSHAGDMEPVLGRQETQRRLWRALLPAAESKASQRLLVVRGKPGSGNRFTRRLVKEYVRRARQPIVSLDLGNQLGATAGSFVEQLLGTLSIGVPEAVPTALTTGMRDARDLLPGLVSGLKEVTARHPVWVVLGFPGQTVEVPDQVSEMIIGIVKELTEIPRLRIVLIGWPAALPRGFDSSIEDLTMPTEDEAVDLLMGLDYDADSDERIAVRADYRSALRSELSVYPAIRRTKELIEERREGGAR